MDISNRRYTTKELEAHIRAVYKKLSPLAREEGVYKELDDNFDSGTPNGQDGSFCFSDEHGYHYCVVERGQLRVNVTTQSLSEITYQVLSSDIFWMAVEFESIHRIKGRDFRRLLFQKEMQYWSILGESLAERAAQKIAETLQKAPYQD